VKRSANVTPASSRPETSGRRFPARKRKTGLATRDFDRVYRDPARRLRSRHFLVLARRRDDALTGAARWGISVKARLGGAVVRNRIKRRLREILRACNLPPAWDIVVQPLSAAVASIDFTALRRELEKLLRAVPAPATAGPTDKK